MILTFKRGFKPNNDNHNHVNAINSNLFSICDGNNGFISQCIQFIDRIECMMIISSIFFFVFFLLYFVFLIYITFILYPYCNNIYYI